jgi:hypothetical protein
MKYRPKRGKAQGGKQTFSGYIRQIAPLLLSGAAESPPINEIKKHRTVNLTDLSS